MKKINWQIIVGAVFVLSAFFSIDEGLSIFFGELICGGVLLLWGTKKIKKENQELLKREAEELMRKEQEAAEEARAKAEREAERKAYEAAVKKREDAYALLIDSIPSATIAIDDARAELTDTGCLADTANSNITKRTDWNKLGNFVAVDTETTGLRATCGVIEIAAVRFRDWEPVEKFHSLCSIDKSIPEDATKINHITDDMVAGKPHFRQISKSLLDFIGSDALVGHNIGFDLKFIVRNGADVTIKKRKYYDTLEIAQRTLKKYEDVINYKLPTLCQYYRINMPDSHRADYDATAAGFLLKHLAHERIPEMPFIPDIEIDG